MPSRGTAIANVLVGDLLTSVVWFPVWWYSTGLRRVATFARNELRYRAEAYSFKIWIKSFFVPMYGQYDIAGRLISVFMRFVVLIGRGVAFVIEALFYLIGLFLWMLAPFMFAMFAVLNAVAAGGIAV